MMVQLLAYLGYKRKICPSQGRLPFRASKVRLTIGGPGWGGVMLARSANPACNRWTPLELGPRDSIRAIWCSRVARGRGGVILTSATCAFRTIVGTVVVTGCGSYVLPMLANPARNIWTALELGPLDSIREIWYSRVEVERTMGNVSEGGADSSTAGSMLRSTPCTVTKGQAGSDLLIYIFVAIHTYDLQLSLILCPTHWCSWSTIPYTFTKIYTNEPQLEMKCVFDITITCTQ